MVLGRLGQPPSIQSGAVTSSAPFNGPLQFTPRTAAERAAFLEQAEAEAAEAALEEQRLRRE